VLGQITKQQLAELNAHWSESVLVSLSVDPKHQVVEVHIRAAQVEKLLNPHPAIKVGKGRNSRPHFTTPDGLPVYYSGDRLTGKS
jgi:hypothetical protein